MIEPRDLSDIEVELFLAAVKKRNDYDFSRYAKASLKRRIISLVEDQRLEHISDLIPQVLHQPGFINKVLEHLSVQVSEMFRDPWVFKKLREVVLPILATYPQINIWLAGCANGEEAYSLAIMLKEEGLLERTNIYATDISQGALAIAQKGIYSIANLSEFEENYRIAGGKKQFSDYYVCQYEYLHFSPFLKENIFFTDHNLASDSVFCESHLVMCRNVMIYFDKYLRDRAVSLFTESLVPGGLLCVGNKENLSFTTDEDAFVALEKKERIFQKKR